MSDQETARLRAAVTSPDERDACRAAELLLALHEPATFADALDLAFAGRPAPSSAQRALRSAWDDFRHDRHRSWN